MKGSLTLGATMIAIVALSGTWSPAQAQGSAELAGGWIVNGWTNADGEALPTPQRGLFVFTASGQYSMMYVPGSEPRPEYAGENPTDQEMLHAYQTLVANSGRYTVDGDRLTYEAYVAKDPNYMAAWNADEPGNPVSVSFSIDDEGILTLTWPGGRAATLRRPGQG